MQKELIGDKGKYSGSFFIADPDYTSTEIFENTPVYFFDFFRENFTSFCFALIYPVFLEYGILYFNTLSC